LEIYVHDLRDFTFDRHKTVDDTPYGGGAGMVMKPEPWALALQEVLEASPSQEQPVLIVPTPSGEVFSQPGAQQLAKSEHLVFACGRYEGIDERMFQCAREHFSGRLMSLGDYVLNGGEIVALAMVEAIGWLVPGVVGNSVSLYEVSR